MALIICLTYKKQTKFKVPNLWNSMNCDTKENSLGEEENFLQRKELIQWIKQKKNFKYRYILPWFFN